MSTDSSNHVPASLRYLAVAGEIIQRIATTQAAQKRRNEK